MKIVTTIARILMGLAFLTFGLNGFFHFIPQPKTMPQPQVDFFTALVKTGYMLPLIFGTQTLVGVLLLTNLFVPLALVIIAPVLVHIIAFHIFLAPDSIPPALVALALECYLVWAYRGYFRMMVTMRSQALT